MFAPATHSTTPSGPPSDIKEFVDRGESARSANRPELQKMLAYLRQTPDVDYVIVHKLDRLARNRADDVEINRVFEEAGVRLISTSENIDQTPGGILLHGIMSSIAEFYSRNLANEVIKGMSEKARNGGTVGKAPLGYLNVRGRDEHGRETRTVELDPERAPLIQLAFSQYATGNWTLRKLADHLAGLGLTTPATPNKPAKPISPRHLHTLLRHPYYKGTITFQDVEYPGKHQPLVDADTWQTVQNILASHRNGERHRIHNHHLKSTIACGLCGSRLLVQNSKNRHHQIYRYFVCARRHRKHDCTFRAVLINEVEEQVTDLYRQIHLTAQDRQLIERYLLDELEHIEATSQNTIRSLTARRTHLKDQRHQLLQAHYNGAVPLDLLKEEQDRLSAELRSIERTLNGYRADTQLVRTHLSQALDLLEDCHRLYQAAPDHLKKQLNHVFFQRILINPEIDDNGRAIIPSSTDTPPTDTSILIDAPNNPTDTKNTTQQPDNANNTAQQSDSTNTSSTAPQPSSAPAEEASGITASATVEDASLDPAPSVPPTLVHNQATGTSAAAQLVPPFDQLTSSSLRHTAHTAAQQEKPTNKGEHASFAGTPPGHAPHSAGSYKDTVVPPLGFEPRTLCLSGTKRGISSLL